MTLLLFIYLYLTHIALNVKAPSAIQVGAVPTAPLCAEGSNGRVSFSYTGGTSPFLLSFGGGRPTSSTTVTGTYVHFPLCLSHLLTCLLGLSAGNYSYSVKDANGCSLSSHVVVSDPQPFDCYITVYLFFLFLIIQFILIKPEPILAQLFLLDKLHTIVTVLFSILVTMFSF